MIAALLFAAGSALLGGALALAARGNRALLERTRTFAFAAAASVVAFHLLPEVLPALGGRALLWAAGGFALPWLLEALARALRPRVGEAASASSLRVAAEVGFVALVFHSLVEGLTLWAALHAPGSHLDLEIAIVAHHAPLTAAVALPFLELKGARSLALRVLGIALAGAVGVLVGSALPGLSASSAELLLPATAATAGALLHVAFDEIGVQRFGSRAERAWDLLAAIGGVGVAALGVLQKGADGPLAGSFLRALLALSLSAAPALLASALAAELFRLRKPLPVLARLLRALPLDAAALTLLFFGPAGLAVRALAAAAFALLGRGGPPEAPVGALAGAARRGPWILCGLLLAAAIHALAGPWALQPAPLALAAAGAVLLASALVPHGAGATAATLVSGVLVLKGAPAPLLLAALAVGSAIDRAALRSRRSLVLLVTVSPAAAAAAVLLHVRATAPASVRWPFGDLLTQLSMRAQPAAAPALLAVLALLAVVVFRSGLRGFLSPLRHGAHREASDL